MTRRNVLAASLVLLSCAALVATGPARAGIDLWQYQTEHLRAITYTEAHQPLVPHLVRSFENSLDFHRGLFAWTPSEPIVVLMQDFGDFGHGGTSTVPWNYISIGIEPFDYVYETMPANERLNWLMHHELVHVVATDKAAPIDALWRKVFQGKVAPTAEQPLSMVYSWLASPRWYAPRWYHEGIAVFLETWMAGGMGRVLGGYDEMAFRTMVREERRFYDLLGLESEGTAIDFQVGQNSYLYGTRFVTWLGLTRGPGKLVQWFDRNEGSARGVTAQFEKVYGEPILAAWRQWIAFEHEWQARNLRRIRTHAVSEDRPITPRALGSVSRAFVDGRRQKLYVGVNYPGRPAHLAAVDLRDGSVERLGDVLGPALYFVTSLAYDPAGDKLFFTSDNGAAWRDLNELDLATGRQRRLLKDCRAGDLVVHPADRAIWAVQHHSGLSSVVRFAAPYTAWQTLVTLPYGTDVFGLDISPDGTLLTASMVEISGRQRLVRFETARLAAGDATAEPLYEFENNGPESFRFSPDGRYVYGSSYYTGVSNLFRIDLRSRDLEALTNAETGYFRPVPQADGSLIAFRYTAQGFLPVRLDTAVRADLEAIDYLGQQVVETHPVVKDWNVGSPLEVDLEAVTTNRGTYRPWRELRFASIYPVVEGYKDTYALGARMNLADPLALHSVVLTAAYSPDDELPDEERWHARLSWDHYPFKVRAGYNPTDFYDLFGPTKRSRKGTFAAVTWDKALLDEKPRHLGLKVSVAGFSGIDRLPFYQNVPATFDEYVTVSGSLDFRNTRGTIGSVEPERGVACEIGSLNDLVQGEWINKAYGNFDVALPLFPHSTLWVRSSAGHSWGDPRQTFSNFYFGGFGNNYVDHLAVRRYRDPDSFPGAEINEIEANNYAKVTLEWTFPAGRFEKAGWPSFYANWIHPAVFVQGLVADAWDDERPRRELLSVGAQVDVKVVLFSNLESTVSVGYARAFEDGVRLGGEWMASLKLLR